MQTPPAASGGARIQTLDPDAGAGRGEQFTVSCRGLVNAAGPLVKTFYDESLSEKSPRHSPHQGSHMIVPAHP